MGKPTLIHFVDGAYARGPELMLNDGAILSEFQGNLDKRANIALFKNSFIVTFNYLVDSVVAAGTQYTPFSFVAPTQMELKHVSHIAYAGDGISDGGFYGTGEVWSASPIATNKLNVGINIKAGLTGSETGLIATATISSGNINHTDNFGGTPQKVGSGYVIEASAQRVSGADNAFLPWVRTTWWFKEEHI